MTTICPNCGEENPSKFRLCGFCGAQLAPALPPQEVRKTVTIVFSDLKGSTSLGESLDSESLREVMNRYFDAMRTVLERHGGTIEKFIGDAVMAVFGLPKLHEDDALRAVRAAADMQKALATLNEELDRVWGVTLTNRTGVNTGEVVAGDPTTGQRLVTGDAVNVAARLEQAAPALDVLLGELTYQLVRDAVEVEAVEPLELKGKAERVPAYRLVSVLDRPEGWTRRQDAPLVGRESELELLMSAFEEACATRSCRLVTVLANPGVGKSRLNEEFLRSVGDRADVLRGRCLSYGDGITFWPLVEALRQAAGIRDDDDAAVACSKLETLVDGDADGVVERIGAMIGLATEQFPIDELFWAARKVFESLARRRPLVVLFDDVHWGASTFLDLVEHVLSTARDAPVLLLCPARPELLEERPGWAEATGATRVALSPLTAADTEEVIERLLGGAGIAEDARRRIAAAAEGNPLFVEQLLSMLVDDGSLRVENGRWVATSDLAEFAVPPSIQALLSARLDQLGAEERTVVEPASVIGLVFATPAVTELAPETVRDRVPLHLATVERRKLVRPELGVSGDDERYRFDHVMIREAAYNSLLKRARATFHERFVDWADRVNRERGRETEFEEILGYHLEQAHRYLAELGPLDEHGISLGVRAAQRLSSAGRRAFARGDKGAAVNLLRRAVTLLAEDDRARVALLPDLGEALMEIGEFTSAEEVLGEAVRRASELGERRLEADALLTHLFVRHHLEESLEGWSDEILREAGRLIPILEQEGAHAQVAKAWRLIGFVHGAACRWGDQVVAHRNAVDQAVLAGDARLEARLTAEYTTGLCEGPTPVPEAVARCEETLQRSLVDRQSEALVLCSLARLRALQAEFDEARELVARAGRLRDDLGTNLLVPLTSLHSSLIETLSGNFETAERDLRTDFEMLSAMGERFFLPLVAALLAQVVYALDRPDEAAAIARDAAGMADEQDVETQALLRGVRAKVLAREGDFKDAERLATEAVTLVHAADAPVMQATALLDLAEVLSRAGHHDRARTALDEALALFELKQCSVAPPQVLTLLETVRNGSPAALAGEPRTVSD
jgi:class 3 adenylate cyclase/tetratricopeptide (TPR) repeat protein